MLVRRTGRGPSPVGSPLNYQAETRAVASVPSETMTNFIDWDDNEYPLAYFITFRTYGTWLHGDERTSVERHGRNIYGTAKVGLDPMFSVKMERNMSSEPLILDAAQ